MKTDKSGIAFAWFAGIAFALWQQSFIAGLFAFFSLGSLCFSADRIGEALMENLRRRDGLP